MYTEVICYLPLNLFINWRGKCKAWTCRLPSGHMVITRTIKPRGTTETYFSPVLSCACFVHGVFLPEYSCGVHLGICSLIENDSGKSRPPPAPPPPTPRSLWLFVACTYVCACICLHNTEEGSEYQKQFNQCWHSRHDFISPHLDHLSSRFTWS